MTAFTGSMLELPLEGMDCPSCAAHLEAALKQHAGIEAVQVFVAARRANISYDPGQILPEAIRKAVRTAGYGVPEGETAPPAAASPSRSHRSRWAGGAGFAGVAALVVLLSIGERLGWIDGGLRQVPGWLLTLGVLALGGKVFAAVGRSTLRRQVTSHTLLTVGVLASLLTREWESALLITAFMRLADWIEGMAAHRGRAALRDLAALRPQTARVLRGGFEVELPVEAVAVGDVLAVRPGERVPVDGTVLEGHVAVDEAPITGESVPVEKALGDPVYAASVAQAGFLRVQATRVGSDTTFARILRLVEEAESGKAPVQRFAERFTTYYLPFVLLAAAGTYLVTGRLTNAVAVLVGACACAIALATPLVVLVSVGRAARRGILIKGGLALEQLARVDTLVLDKTGTLTTGRPWVTEVVSVGTISADHLLRAAAALELRSEHVLGQAVVAEARKRGLRLAQPELFTAVPGRGISGCLDQVEWTVGNRRLLAEREIPLPTQVEDRAAAWEAAGRTVFFVCWESEVAGLIAVEDTLREGARPALAEMRDLGFRRIVMLTGDNQRVAARVAGELDIEYRANLLPEDKIAFVRALQASGARVLMVGDGINDAPALAAAEVGVAMGEAGTEVAAEAAGAVLLRDDWSLLPEAVRIARRAGGAIRQNLGFTAVYNLAALSLAAAGLLTPVLAAAAHSLPDVVILLNSGRLFYEPRRSRQDAVSTSRPEPSIHSAAPDQPCCHAHSHDAVPAHSHCHTHNHTHCHR